MRRFILIIQIMILFGIKMIFSQQNPESKNQTNQKQSLYKKTLDNELKKYKDSNWAIQPKLLNENISIAFSNIIFSSSDLVTNASAFGYSQNEEKTNVTINSNVRMGGKSSNKYLRIGGTLTGTKNVFEFYSDDSWSNNSSINLGYVFKVFTSKMSFLKSENKNKLLMERRRIIGNQPFYNKDWYSQETMNCLVDLMKEILDGKDRLTQTRIEVLKIKPGLDKLYKEKKFEELYIQLKKEKEKIEKYLKVIKYDDPKKMSSYLSDTLLYNFDKANDITYGYNIRWIDFNLSLGNSTYKFSEENVDEDIFEDFNDEFDLSDDLNKLKLTLSASYNGTRNKKKTVWYYQVGISVTSGSFLENSFINGTPKVIQNVNGQYVLQDEDERNLGNYEDIKETIITGSFNSYGAIFFAEKKNFGLNASLSHNYLINKPGNVFYENNFTALFGPVFRKVKEDKTNLTFGIDVGWENAIYNSRISDSFTGRVRLGIPFNIYKKDNKKKEKQ